MINMTCACGGEAVYYLDKTYKEIERFFLMFRNKMKNKNASISDQF